MDGEGLEDALGEPASVGGVLGHPSAEGRGPRVARGPAAPQTRGGSDMNARVRLSVLGVSTAHAVGCPICR
eukprot:11647939-Alexandrium_andersonii.AAC.1